MYNATTLDLTPPPPPKNPELAIDTTGRNIDEAVQQILLKLEHEGYLR